MPLPSPTVGIPQNAPSMNAKDPVVEEIKDVKLTLKEAVTTGLKAGFMTTSGKLLDKIPLFGKGLSEKIEFEKRKMFEKQGRDPLTGRKLTKEEIEERALRKKSMGAMGEINDNVTEILRILKKYFDNKSVAGFGLGFGKSKDITPSETTSPYEIADESGEMKSTDEAKVNPLSEEEKQLEAQKEEKDQKVEIQERNEKFLDKLFAKYFGGAKTGVEGTKEESGGLFSKIAGAVDFLADAKSLGGGRLLGGAGRMLGGAGRLVGIGGVASAGAAGAAGAAGSVGAGAVGAAGAAGAAGSAGTGAANVASGAGKGFFGKAFEMVGNVGSKIGKGLGAAKSFVGKGLTAAGEMAAKLNPTKFIKSGVAKVAPKILKGAVAIPGLGAAIEAVLGGIEISNIKSDATLTAEEKKEKIGVAIGKTLGSILGTIGGGALGSLIPIPGVGTLIGSMGGAWVGGMAGEAIADALGGKGIYDLLASIPLIGDLIKVEDTQAPTGAEGEMPQTAPSPGDVPSGSIDVQGPKDAMDEYTNTIPMASAATTSIPTANYSPTTPSMTPTSATSLGSLQAENDILKMPAPSIPVVAPTTNNVITNNNSTSWMSALTTTKTGADMDERAFRLAFG